MAPQKITLLSLLVFICACAMAQAQITNYVKNPSFEDTVNCPNEINQVGRSKYWSCAVDTLGEPYYAPEYYNACAGTAFPIVCGVPENFGGYQYSRTGNAYIGAHLYYDKTAPPPAGLSSNWRDYFQGHLYQPLQNGKTYCVSFWVVLGEISGYAHNKIGAYIDNGGINKLGGIAGDAITSIVPQIFTTTKIKDTLNWTKVEGSFVATGNETHITIGNFAKQVDVDTQSVPYYAPANQYSYYLFDDISVIPIDLNADAGADTWVEQGSKRKIGRVADTTALGLDCKWYKKGVLIDSGAIISVNANAVKGVVDTYVVVQTICGVVKRDTVLVKTVGLGVHEFGFENTFSIFPNPSNGTFTISSSRQTVIARNEAITAKVYDLLGCEIFHQKLSFSNKQSTVKLDIPNGSYLLELQDEAGNVQRERIVIN